MTCLSAGAACQLEDTTAKLREPGMQGTYCVLVFIFKHFLENNFILGVKSIELGGDQPRCRVGGHGTLLPP